MKRLCEKVVMEPHQELLSEIQKVVIGPQQELLSELTKIQHIYGFLGGNSIGNFGGRGNFSLLGIYP